MLRKIMGYYCMANNDYDYVIDKPDDLFEVAQGDIVVISDIITGKNKKYDNDRVGGVLFHAQQAVEKILKGYIREYNPNYKIRLVHDLNYLYEIARPINKQIEDIKSDCGRLNPYSVVPRYDSNIKLKNIEIENTLSSLQKIYNLKPIKDLRNILIKRNQDIGLPEEFIEQIINYHKGIMKCYKYYTTNNDLTKSLKDIEEIVNYPLNKNDERIEKIVHKNNKQYALQRIKQDIQGNINNDVFLFKYDFTREMAFNFLKNWDNKNVVNNVKSDINNKIYSDDDGGRGDR